MNSVQLDTRGRRDGQEGRDGRARSENLPAYLKSGFYDDIMLSDNEDYMDEEETRALVCAQKDDYYTNLYQGGAREITNGNPEEFELEGGSR